MNPPHPLLCIFQPISPRLDLIERWYHFQSEYIRLNGLKNKLPKNAKQKTKVISFPALNCVT